ncbi:MAG: hypothetical protein QOK15_2143 [Nocardioidaceae bacterium]|jgi:hypothetical protein|nr:hypothetical protein [Nocardioidaceae bacterium]
MGIVEDFRFQAHACAEIGSPMYAELLARVVEDIEARGVTRTVLAGHEDDPGPSALALRLLGSVHRLVLERRAGDLALFYPSVGGHWDVTAGWPAFERVLRDQPEAVREWLDRAPQTNEVGRAAALYGGLLHLPRDLPVRLMEIGSSGGLNLRADQFGYRDASGRTFGGSGLMLENAWRGRPLDAWPDLQVVDRVGSDIAPVDVTTTEGRLRLTAYVWPDQVSRLERLRAAFRVAADHPAEVREQDAVTFVAELEPVEGGTTVLWHSVMWQYLPRPDRAAIAERIEELGRAATTRRRFAHLRAEPGRRSPDAEHEFLVRLRTWPGGEERLLGTAVAHGLPTTWE